MKITSLTFNQYTRWCVYARSFSRNNCIYFYLARCANVLSSVWVNI